MKLLLVIVNEEFLKRISKLFTDLDYSATIIASTGEFLQYGDTIFLLGVDDEKSDDVIQSLKDEMGENEVVIKHQASELKGKNVRITVYLLSISQYIKSRGGLENNDRSKEKGTQLLSKESR